MDDLANDCTSPRKPEAPTQEASATSATPGAALAQTLANAHQAGGDTEPFDLAALKKIWHAAR